MYAWLMIVMAVLFQTAFADTAKPAGTLAKITSISVAHPSDVTQIVFEIAGGAFRYKWHFYPDTLQLSVDIDRVSLATLLPKQGFASTLIKNYKYELQPRQNPSEISLQFQLKIAVDTTVYTIPESKDRGALLVLDLKPLPTLVPSKIELKAQPKISPHPSKTIKKHTVKNPTTPTPQPVVSPSNLKNQEKGQANESQPHTPYSTKEEKPAVKMTDYLESSLAVPKLAPLNDLNAGTMGIATQKILREKQAIDKAKKTWTDKKFDHPIMVVIDPGHGGKDPGAIGPGKTREKDVVLAISKLLQQTFKQQPGFNAQLTRYRDVFIPLRQRLAIARRAKADIFIAVHADATYQNQNAVGASVFALSERGATSEGARWLAQKENESELVNGVIVDKDHLLRSVLLDLSQTHTIAVSLEIGKSILNKLSIITKLHYPQVEQAAFVVLKSPDIPSLLIETGYLSNPIQEKKLNDRMYQQQLANAIVQGVVDYFVQHPPTR
jgi:N-acetylmuramoyl-L-alanine amidase